MKHFSLLILIIGSFVLTTKAQSQLPDTCKATGYFFNNAISTSSQDIDMVKARTQIRLNR